MSLIRCIDCFIGLKPVAVVLLLPLFLNAQETVSFMTQDSGRVFADVYGSGTRGVVLVHGGRFNKESWSDQARELSGAGFHVVAINLRGYGKSTGPGESDLYTAPLFYDVLAAVQYLRTNGAINVSVIGASMGGWCAAKAALESPGSIDRLIVLAAPIDGPPELLKVRKLFIVAAHDTTADGIPRVTAIRRQFEQMPEPKELVVLQGSAHAQFLFQTPEGTQLMKEMLRFLTTP